MITFKTKLSNLVSEIAVPVISLLIMITIVTISLIDGHINVDLRESFIYILIIMILGLYFSFFRKILIAIDYYKHDRNRLITIDTDMEKLEIETDGHKEVIPFSTIYLIYRYYGQAIGIQYYYKLILKEPLSTGEENVIITYLTIPYLNKYIKTADYREKDVFNLFIPKKS